MNNYIPQAKRLYRIALTELNTSKKTKDEDIAREAAGKAWIATTDAFRGFLLTRGLPENELPKSDHNRQVKLAKYGDEKMWQLFGRIKGDIHQDAYYEGMINYTLLIDAFKDVKKFIYQCENSG